MTTRPTTRGRTAVPSAGARPRPPHPDVPHRPPGAPDLPDLDAGLRALVVRTGPKGRLPAERMLADRFGVGRTLVRRALRDLHEEGRVVIRAQSGTYVVG